MRIDTFTMARVGRIRTAITKAEQKIWNNKDFIKHKNEDLRCSNKTETEILIKQLRMLYAGELLGLDKKEVEHYIFEIHYEPPEEWQNWLLFLLDRYDEWQKAIRFIQYHNGDDLK